MDSSLVCTLATNKNIDSTVNMNFDSATNKNMDSTINLNIDSTINGCMDSTITYINMHNKSIIKDHELENKTSNKDQTIIIKEINSRLALKGIVRPLGCKY